MIILDVPQGTPEWYAARCGIPTASDFSKILTSRGLPSTQVTDYIHTLVAEVLATIPLPSYTSAWMARGQETEQEALNFYAFTQSGTVQYWSKVQQVGLCYQNEERLWSCSPDALVGEDGGLELKCPSPHYHIKYLLEGKLPCAYKAQVQGSLWITGRDWWDFMSYHPGLPAFIIRVERDEAYIGRLAKAVVDTSERVNEKIEILREKYSV